MSRKSLVYTLISLLLMSFMMNKSSIQFKILDIPSFSIHEKEITITFEVINHSNKSFMISDPRYLVNFIPIIKYNNQSYEHCKKINPDLSKLDELICLKPLDTIELDYSYKLDELCSFSEAGEFTIQFEFNGNIYDENKKKIDMDIPLVSNTKKFNVIYK
jgi:hypothetical protein